MNDARGLYRKFIVERTDGRSGPGEKHDGCRYFVIDLDHDPFAFDALMVYAEACSEENPNLASDLSRMIMEPFEPVREKYKRKIGGESYASDG